MRSNTRKAAIAAGIIAAAIASGAWAGGALSSTQAGISTSPEKVRAGFGSSPGTRQLAVTSRKAGKEQQEYLLAIPGVRGNGQSGGCYERPC